MPMSKLPLTADAVELAELIADGQVSATEALDDALERTALIDPKLNALCLLRPEQAREIAAQIDQSLVRARRTPADLAALRRERPFLGVPTVLKDTGTAALGLPSTQGSRLFGQIDWPLDSELVCRYRQAGLVPFGRSTSPEMAISPSTEALAYGGPTRNPWNPQISPGGSSGGAAAALAARIVRIAHGTDGAGSIRIPAACCGVVGLKPTRGLVPMGPLAGEGWGGLLVEHMLTLSVRDCAAALDASAGQDVGAPYSAPAYAGALAGVVRTLAGEEPAAMRIAVLDTTLDGDPIDPQVADAVRQIADTLQSLGHQLEQARPQVRTEQILRPMIDVVACGTAMAVERELLRRGKPLAANELEPTTIGAWRHGCSLTGAQYLARLSELHQLNRVIGRFFDDGTDGSGFDLMLMPVLARPTAPLGRWAMNNPDFLDYRLGPQGLIHYSPFTPIANMTGQPAISLPLATSDQGLPIGIQLMARFGRDAELLRLSAQLERVLPWADRIPPIAASV